MAMVEHMISRHFKIHGYDVAIEVDRYGEAEYGSYIEIEETLEPGKRVQIHIMGSWNYADASQQALRKSWAEICNALSEAKSAITDSVQECMNELDKLEAGNSSE